MILEWQAALAEAAEMSRQGCRGPAEGQTCPLDLGLFPPRAKLTRGAADPRLPGVGLGSIIATSLSQLETRQ